MMDSYILNIKIDEEMYAISVPCRYFLDAYRKNESLTISWAIQDDRFEVVLPHQQVSDILSNDSFHINNVISEIDE